MKRIPVDKSQSSINKLRQLKKHRVMIASQKRMDETKS